MATYYWVGGSGTWDNASTANWSASSGGAAGAGPPTNADTAIFDANSGTAAVVTVAGTAVAAITTIDKSDINLSLSGNPTLSVGTGNVTLTAGTITLNNNILTVARFTSNNTNARAIAFGTSGKLVVTSNNGDIFSMQDMTNFTRTGEPRVEFSYSGSTGMRIMYFGSSAGAGASNVLSMYVTAGTDIIANPGAFKDYDLTGFSGTHLSYTRSIIGNMVISATCTNSAGNNTIFFLAPSGVQTLTTNGQVMDFPLARQDAAELRLNDNLTMGATRSFTLTSGTLNLNGKTLTAGSFSSSGTGTRVLAFNGGNITLSGSGTVWNAATATNLSTTGTGTISLTSASAKTFAGGGITYPTINQGGAGALTISGSNTFSNITNTTQPATISLTAGTTTTVTNFSVSGTAGNLITLNSTSAGSRATLTDSGGVNSVSYVDIKDIAAIGYGEWQAYTSNGNVDSGNNVGWVFTAPPPLTASEYQISLKSFTERRSF